MLHQHWQKVAQLFEASLEQPPNNRSRFLQERCGEDDALKNEVKSLLAADAKDSTLIDRPIMGSIYSLLERAEASRSIGRMIGPYRIEQRLAQGGMGTVFGAVRADGQYQQKVAIKIVRHELDTDLILDRFRRERQALANLRHPHIAALLDGGTTDEGLPYLVMEYISGQPITRHCEQQELGVRRRIELFLQVCSAVQYAHQNLIVHRDLKPSNILVTGEGIPKLLDFGIAKILDESRPSEDMAQTSTTQRLLTPIYASPEQIRGHTINTSTDVYSLGVVLYELLSGCHPFSKTGQDPKELERAICEQTPEPPSVAVGRSQESSSAQSPATIHTPDIGTAKKEDVRTRFRRQIRGDLDNIVLMALRKEPYRRYSSVESLAGDLRNYLQGLPVQARKDTLAYRTARFVQRNKIGVIAAGLVFLSLAVQSVVSTRMLFDAHDMRLEANLALNKVQRTTEMERLYALRMAADQWVEVIHLQRDSATSAAARQLLDDFAIRADTIAATYTPMRCELLSLVGMCYLKLGEHALARENLEKALQISQKINGPLHPQTADIMAMLAMAYDSSNPAYAQHFRLQASHILRKRYISSVQPPPSRAGRLPMPVRVAQDE